MALNKNKEKWVASNIKNIVCCTYAENLNGVVTR